ncbi:MAG: hypothetical protein AAF353_12495 [Pseudomonadota bacterium]
MQTSAGSASGFLLDRPSDYRLEDVSISVSFVPPLDEGEIRSFELKGNGNLRIRDHWRNKDGSEVTLKIKTGIVQRDAVRNVLRTAYRVGFFNMKPELPIGQQTDIRFKASNRVEEILVIPPSSSCAVFKIKIEEWDRQVTGCDGSPEDFWILVRTLTGLKHYARNTVE